MRGFAILLGFQLLGVLLNAAGVPLPGAVLGLILLSAALFAGAIKLEWVEASAGFLLRHMLLFFAPAIVGAVALLNLLKAEGLAVACAIVVSLVVVLLVTGWVASLLIPSTPSSAAEPPHERS